MNKIRKALLMTEEEYECLILHHWFEWCEKYALNQDELQKFLANAALFRWWKSLYDHMEVEFYKKLPFESDDSKKGRYLLHLQCVLKVRNFFSKSLMSNAKKLELHG
ncbi:MAG: hypothetical protein AAF717_00160 [Bacteroidota bacterium]